MIHLDGSMGEGGGQILRTALALSALTGKPFEIVNIRSNRPRPGLRPQHLESVKAAARICSAQVQGAAEDSTTLEFHPGPVQPGRYRFEIRTAGSSALVLQTIFVPLALARGESRVEIRGGTHVPWSPCYHYLELQWAEWLGRVGLHLRLELRRAGFYPEGGGEMQAVVEPVERIKALRCLERGALRDVEVISAACNLPQHIAERQLKRALWRLEGLDIEPQRQILRLPAHGKGSFLMVRARFEDGQGCYFSLGAIGKPSEKVADEAAKALLGFIQGEAVMDEHLADQLLLPLALAAGESQFSTPCVTSHLLTNAEVIRRFLPVDIRIEGDQGKPGKVSLLPRGESATGRPA